MPKKYYDSDGNLISIEEPTSGVQKKPKYYDSEGNLLDLSQLASIGAKPEFSDYFREYVGKYAKPVSSMLGGIAGSLISPVAGSAAGTALGNLAGQQLQEAAPKFFGKPPTDAEDVLLDVGLDTALSLIPTGLAKAYPYVKNYLKMTPVERKVARATLPIIRESPSIQQKMMEETNRELAEKLQRNYFMSETPIIETAAERVRMKYPSNPPKMWGTIGEDLAQVPYIQKDFVKQHISKIANRAFSDITELRNFKLATGGSDLSEQLGLNRVIKVGWNDVTKQMNPTKILEELGGKKAELYKEAMRPTTYKNFVEFLKEAEKLQTHKRSFAENILSYADGQFVMPLGTFLFNVARNPLRASGAALGGLVITEKAIQKLMSDDATAKLVLQALKTPKSSPIASDLENVLVRLISGTGLAYLKTPDGELHSMEPPSQN